MQIYFENHENFFQDLHILLKPSNPFWNLQIFTENLHIFSENFQNDSQILQTVKLQEYSGKI